MIKLVFTCLALLTIAGCDRAPAPSRLSQPAAPFTILAERPDPATNSLAVDIKVGAQATEAAVKEIAEGVIADRRGRHSSITVRSYLDAPEAGALPYGVSRLENNSVTHRFNQQGETRRIPTH
jgi:hypothetical protein